MVSQSLPYLHKPALSLFADHTGTILDDVSLYEHASYYSVLNSKYTWDNGTAFLPYVFAGVYVTVTHPAPCIHTTDKFFCQMTH